MFTRSLALLGATASLAHAVAFPAPDPTPIAGDAYRDVVGWTPMPTPGPFDFFKKRAIAGDRTCGWYPDGTSTQAITCGQGDCMLYTPSGAVGMVGCCTSSAGSVDYQSCGWVNKCIDYSEYLAGECDSDCMANSFIRLCTGTSRPYCQSWTYMLDAVRDYGCGTESYSTWITVKSRIANTEDGTATAQVPFVPAAATVTGWDGKSTNTARIGTASDVKTGTGTIGTGVSTRNPTSTSFPQTSTRSASVVVLAIIIVIIVIALCGAACIVTWFCIRSKRNVKKWEKPSMVAAGAAAGAAAAPLMHNQQSNVASPNPSTGPMYGQQQPQYPPQQGYFPPGQAPPPNGAAADYYGSRDQKLAASPVVQPVASPYSSTPITPIPPPYVQPVAAPMAPTQAMPQQYGQAYPMQNMPPHMPPPQHGAVELPHNPQSRPGGGQIAELG